MSASMPFVRALADGLDGLGYARAQCEALLARAGLSGDDRVPLERLEALLVDAADVTGNPAIGLEAGHRFRVSGHGRTGSIYAHATDLPDVIELNQRYQRLAVDMGKVREDRSLDKPRMCFQPYYPTDTAEDRATFSQCSAMLMAAYVTAYRWLNWGSGEDLVGVGIPAPGCAHRQARAEALFGCPVAFDQPHGYLVFTERAMSTPLTTADPEKRALLIAMLDSVLGQSEQQASFLRAVHAAMRGAMASGPVTLGTVAARLELADAELSRKLKAIGLQFRSELDAQRRAVMAERIADGDSLASVAAALGYNDQAAFNRAVRRWYGVSPGQWTPDLPVIKR